MRDEARPLEPGQVFAFVVLMGMVAVGVAVGLFELACWLLGTNGAIFN